MGNNEECLVEKCVKQIKEENGSDDNCSIVTMVSCNCPNCKPSL